MKRILLILALIIAIPNLQATGHIKFMGIEVSGDYEIKDSLLSKGFTYISTYETLHKFYGNFANEIVTLNVLASPKTRTVCKVIVYFPKREKWQDLKKDYFAKKKMYKTKYPIDKDYEFFSIPYEDGDGYEMRALERDKCKYISFFFAIGGHIIIEIDKDAQLKVAYEDRENIKVARQELEQNAINDI